ncbi:hypothetical protein F8388_024415 [Cannabis sativa]|uniref:Uncharacterized protein n=1 Tax=Cannabis sativa TaxID=3483 RepID=A0A7J6EHH8_CANSA|nr:hypothetical protein F8388_024415 [Cannabis sativa]
MGKDISAGDSNERKPGLLKDQIQLVKRKDSTRYEIVPIKDSLSFEKGFFIVIRACQLLAQHNEGIILIGLAGPSGAGKTVFTEKILNFMPSIAVISMDNYNDASRIVDGNFDDPRLTDYDTLLQNVSDLKEGKEIQVPVYDFKSSSRIGYRTVEVPSSRIVIIEGIYALSERLRPLLDLRVSVTGGVHFDLVKRVIRDIQRAGQEPQEIIHQISETVYPMYKAFIEPDLQTAHIKITNKFNPFTGFQSPTYILKVDFLNFHFILPFSKEGDGGSNKDYSSEDYIESTEQTYDIYLLPPGEDPESCQSYLRMRNKDGKYSLMFEEWVTDNPFVISPRITFEVSVRLLGGLMALGYTIATILREIPMYFLVQGKDRLIVRGVAEQLGLEGTYTPRTYIEQIQLEKLVNEVMSYTAQGDKNISKLTGYAAKGQGYGERNSVPNSTLANQLSDQISSLNDRMDEFTNHIEELNSKLSQKKNSSSQQNIALQAEACNGSAPTSYFMSRVGNGSMNGSLMPNSLSSSQLAKDSPILEEISSIARGQRQIIHQLDSISNLLRENTGEKTRQIRTKRKNITCDTESFTVPLVFTALAVAGTGVLLFKGFFSRN